MNLVFAGAMPDCNTEQEIMVACDFCPLEQQTKSKTISVNHGKTNPSILSVPKCAATSALSGREMCTDVHVLS